MASLSRRKTRRGSVVRSASPVDLIEPAARHQWRRTASASLKVGVRLEYDADSMTPQRSLPVPMSAPRLYSDLASLWRLFSPPEEYLEEVETFRARFQRHGVPDGGTLLHLGSGGGSVDYHLKQFYRVTGVDISEEMIAQARQLNPEVE
jgi:SAM-dependent methyltransferase